MPWQSLFRHTGKNDIQFLFFQHESRVDLTRSLIYKSTVFSSRQNCGLLVGGGLTKKSAGAAQGATIGCVARLANVFSNPREI